MGIPDRTDSDCRTPIRFDLRGAGGDEYIAHPMRRRIAWRLWNLTREELAHTASIKELLHWMGDKLARMRAFE